METARDSIKYIRPVYTNNQTADFPWGTNTSMDDRTFGDLNTNGTSEFGSADYRKAMYETTESRYATELANGVVAADAAGNAADGGFTATFDAGPFTQGYIDGYGTIVVGDETKPLAIQTRSGSWAFGQPVMAAAGEWYRITAVSTVASVTSFVLETSADGATGWAAVADAALASVTGGIKAFARFNSENDLTGEYLGEVELIMTDYQFRPRPLTLGVTWTKLTELVLDTSFGVSAEEMLLDAAGQEIKKALDFRAVHYAYGAQAQMAGDQVVSFDAAAGNTGDDSYFHTAQLITQSIARIGDLQLNKLNRGGVSRIVGGPAAVTYLSLYKGFTTKGAQPKIGGHQVGEIDGIPVFKVPSSIIPDNELLTVWKNDQNEADVSIAFGTLLPFFSTGALQRKNLYQEAAVARFEDQQVLQPGYLGKIKINNIRNI
jgi:hypothetical protein